jgi:hypothetical protein
LGKKEKMKPEESIRFETKKEANERRTQEALNRTPHERLLFFIELAKEMQTFKSTAEHPNRAKNNFVIE